jgi:hypothetical protein
LRCFFQPKQQLTSWIQYLPAKASPEPANTTEAGSENFDRFAIEDMYFGLCQGALNFLNLPRLKIVVPDHTTWGSIGGRKTLI